MADALDESTVGTDETDSAGGQSRPGGRTAASPAETASNDDGDGGGGHTTATPAAPSAAAPTVDLVTQRCSGGKLIATVTANASSAFRTGVQSVTMTRQNDEEAYISPSNATWLGPDTGAGDQWDGTLVGNSQGYGKTLRVVATSDTNQSTTREVAITVPC